MSNVKRANAKKNLLNKIELWCLVYGHLWFVNNQQMNLILMKLYMHRSKRRGILPRWYLQEFICPLFPSFRTQSTKLTHKKQIYTSIGLYGHPCAKSNLAPVSGKTVSREPKGSALVKNLTVLYSKFFFLKQIPSNWPYKEHTRASAPDEMRIFESLEKASPVALYSWPLRLRIVSLWRTL